MSQADLKAAQAEPTVKAALELFGGSIVHVRREGPGTAATGTESKDED
jgi:hypothetical protein